MERAWCWYEISPCPFWYTMNPAGILITQYLAEFKHSQNAVLHGSEYLQIFTVKEQKPVSDSNFEMETARYDQ